MLDAGRSQVDSHERRLRIYSRAVDTIRGFTAGRNEAQILTLRASPHFSCAWRIFFSRFPVIVDALPLSRVPRPRAEPTDVAPPGLLDEKPSRVQRYRLGYVEYGRRATRVVE